MGLVKVSPEEMEAVATRLLTASGEIDTKLKALQADVRGMENIFQGQAAGSFQQLYDKWNVSGTNLNAALSDISVMLTKAAGIYRDTDEQIAQQFSQ